MKEITVQQLKEKLANKSANFMLIDVREDFEYMVSNNGASTFHYPVYKVDYTLLIKTLSMLSFVVPVHVVQMRVLFCRMKALKRCTM